MASISDMPRSESNEKVKRYPILRSLIRHFFHEPSRYTGKNEEHEALFQRSEDPWNFLGSPYEQERLKQIAAIARSLPHERTLEVGCAEGALTELLSTFVKDLVAIDVSETAITRARKRSPSHITLRHLSLEDLTSERPFDLIVCTDTLYYMKDIPHALSKLNQLARYVLVGYTIRESMTLDPFFRSTPLIVDKTFVKREFLFMKRATRIIAWESAQRVVDDSSTSLPLVEL